MTIEELTKSRIELDDQLNVLRTEEDWLKSYTDTLLESQDSVINPIDYTELSNLLAFRASNTQRIDQERNRLLLAIEDLNKELVIVEKLLNDNDAPTFETKNQVTIVLDVKSPKELTLSLSYVIAGASWKSRYDARVDSAQKGVLLNYLGVITNSTGEDWNNVAVHLSTAAPTLGGSPPKLNPLRIDYQQQQIDRAYHKSLKSPKFRLSLQMEKESLSYESKDRLAAPAPKVQQLEAKVKSTEGATSVNYEIRRTVKIASDGKPHKVPITEITLPVDFEYIVLPSKGPNAYLKAHTTNESVYQLLSGEMNVFIDDYFITTSKLEQTLPGDKINLFLGIDNGVKVNILPIQKHESTTAIIFTAKKTHLDITKITRITNNKNFDISVIAYLELPSASDENIVIKKLEPADNHKSVTIDIPSNVLQWKLNIPAGESKETKLVYSIEYPSDNKLFYAKQNRPITY